VQRIATGDVWRAASFFYRLHERYGVRVEIKGVCLSVGFRKRDFLSPSSYDHHQWDVLKSPPSLPDLRGVLIEWDFDVGQASSLAFAAENQLRFETQ
jgi:hypothetical protein